jgi:flavorubredoxin
LAFLATTSRIGANYEGATMSTVLSEPTLHQDPTEVVPGVYVIHEVQHALGQPLSVYINSAVIDGEEPVLVDTGSRRNRRAWVEDTFGVVDPQRVKWVFLSHEDSDHVGNLDEVMELCPNATLVCSWAITERHTNAFEFPLERCRWVNDGDTFDAGDRQMTVVRPPLYDSPTTRGLFDRRTGVYWAVDCFATPVPGGVGTDTPARDVAELADEFWTQGMTMFAFNALAPWLRLVDSDRFASQVQRLADLDISAIISAHSPVLTGRNISDVLAKTRQLPYADCPPPPGQDVLDLIFAAMHE